MHENYHLLLLITGALLVHSSPPTVIVDSDSVYVSLDVSPTLGAPNNPNWPDQCDYADLCGLGVREAYKQGLHVNEWIYSISPGRQCIVALWVPRVPWKWPWFPDCSEAFTKMKDRLNNQQKRAQGVKAGFNIDAFPSDPAITDWTENVFRAFPTEKTGAQLDDWSPSYLMIGSVILCFDVSECYTHNNSLPETSSTSGSGNSETSRA